MWTAERNVNSKICRDRGCQNMSGFITALAEGVACRLSVVSYGYHSLIGG